MKVITTIYLNCRPDLRDEWLTGNEVDDAQDALVSNNTRIIAAVNSLDTTYEGPGASPTEAGQILCVHNVVLGTCII